MTREDLIKIARLVVEGINRPYYCKTPASFDPHEWVLDAMKAAYRAGQQSLHDTLPCTMQTGDGLGHPSRPCGVTPTVGTYGENRYCDRHMRVVSAAVATTLVCDV